MNCPPIFPSFAAFLPGLPGFIALMMLTLLTFAILGFSTLLVVGNLRMIVSDTAHAVGDAVQRTRKSGQIVPRLALLVLWVMIFALSFI